MRQSCTDTCWKNRNYTTLFPQQFLRVARLQNEVCAKTSTMCILGLGSPRSQTGPRIPISWKRGFRVRKPPFPRRPYKCWKREFSVQKSPFSMCSLGVFGPRNPLFQEMGIRGSVWGQADPNTRRIVKISGFTRGVCKNRGFY